MKLHENDDLEFLNLDDEYDSSQEEDDTYEEDDDFDDELDERTLRLVHRVLFPSVIVLVVLIVVVAAIFLFKDGKKAVPAVEPVSETEEQGQDVDLEEAQDVPSETDDALTLQEGESEGDGAGTQGNDVPAPEENDPETETMSTEQGTEVDVSMLLSSEAAAETDEITFGIDVARYQGTIDWAQVAASGVDFAMVRVGYRMDASREIVADSNARYNMQEAQKNGIKLGAYFFSTAVNEEEARAEADWTADYISQYQITYPVAFDCEGFERTDSAQYGLTATQRTDIAIAFLNRIYERGYTPMFYSSMNEMAGDAKWETSRIEKTYRIWVSQYPSAPYPQTEKSSYGGTHAMWQYTNRGTVAGISQPVDVNIAYFGYEGAADARNGETPEEAQADVEALMPFTAVEEEVTAKDATNLRNIPSQGEDSTVVYTLKNGETVKRTDRKSVV